jgi:hypothetical protein
MYRMCTDLGVIPTNGDRLRVSAGVAAETLQRPVRHRASPRLYRTHDYEVAITLSKLSTLAQNARQTEEGFLPDVTLIRHGI